MMKDIFDNCKLGNLNLKSRIIRTGLWESQTTPVGRLTKQVYDRYEELAKNKVGLITTELISMFPQDTFSDISHKPYNTDFVYDFKKLANRVHKYQTPILAQLVFEKYNRGIDKHISVNDLTVDDIRKIQTQIIILAKKLSFANFDGIQLNIGNNFYLSKFINPYYNQREYQYGQTTEGRMRILLEVIKVLKDNYDLHINCRINAYDGRKGGISADESILMCKLLEEYGADSIQVTKPLSPLYFTKEEKNSELIDYTKELISNLDIPVILAGGLNDKNQINDILNTTDMEFFSMYRPFIAQKDLLTQWKENKSTKSKCIMCNNCYRTKISTCVHF